MPSPRGRRLAIGIAELQPVFGTQEVRDRVAVLVAAHRDDAVQAGVEPLAGEETQRVSNVDDGMSVTWRDPVPLILARGLELETPLLSEEQSQGANVGVVVVACTLLVRLLGVVQQDQRGVGGGIVAVVLLEAVVTGKVQNLGKRREERLVDEVGAADEAVEERELFPDRSRELRRFFDKFCVGNLVQLAILLRTARLQVGFLCLVYQPVKAMIAP